MLLSNLKSEYGRFHTEQDGRTSGHVLAILSQRRDGKFKCVHIFASSGRRITKIYDAATLALEIALVEKIADISDNLTRKA